MKYILKLCAFEWLIIFFIIVCTVSGYDSNEQSTVEDISSNEESIWETDLIEIDSVNLQILDKISGKVFRKKIAIGSTVTFGSIQIELKRAFKNSPEDDKEIYAYIIIYENHDVIFSNWLFASSPSINLPIHSVYDVRVEFDGI